MTQIFVINLLKIYKYAANLIGEKPMKRLFFLIPITIVLLNLITCVENSKKVSSNDDIELAEFDYDSSSKENLKHTEFDYKNAIELRNADLWLGKKDLEKLVLDGKIYTIDMQEVINIVNYTNVGISYPLICIGGKKIYDLEKETEFITLSKIVGKLKKVWGSKVAVKDYDWVDGPIKPENFTFIDNFKYNSDRRKVCISMHSFFADTFDSMVGIYDTDTDTITFISNPFFGQVYTVSFSEGTEYLAYSYSYFTGDFFETSIAIIDSETMKYVHRTNLSEIVIKDNISDQESLYRIDIEKFYWQEDELNAKLEIHKTAKLDPSKEIVEVIEIKVWSY